MTQKFNLISTRGDSIADFIYLFFSSTQKELHRLFSEPDAPEIFTLIAGEDLERDASVNKLAGFC